jgi:transposase InsO family protein
MDDRTEFAGLAASGRFSMAELCRRFDISRPTGYKWLERYRAEGGKGLLDRSCRPLKSPSWCGAEAEALVLKIRSQNPAWGGRKINKRLKVLGHRDVPAASTITEILRRNGLISPSSSAAADRMQRYEREQPNELWQMDFKGPLAMREGSCHAFTMLDDHSRYSLSLRACPDQRHETVQVCLEHAFLRYGLPWKLLADNGSPWGGEGGVMTRLSVWLLKLGVVMIHGRPYHPQTQGKEERFHRTLNEEVLRRADLENRARTQRLFDRWRDVYNLERPHEALGLEPPVSRYRPSTRRWTGKTESPEPAECDERRQVKEGGYVRWRGERWYIGQAWDQELVGLRKNKAEGVMEVRFGPYVIAELDDRHPGGVKRVPVGRFTPSVSQPNQPPSECQ